MSGVSTTLSVVDKMTSPIEKIGESIESLNKKLDELSKNIEKSMKKKPANELNSAFLKLGAVVTGALSISALTNFGSSCVSEFTNSANAVTQLATVLSNTSDDAVAAMDKIQAKATQIENSGMYSGGAMVAGAGELATYFSDPEAITSMMDTLSNYAAGMSGGGEVSDKAMVDYATGLGKIMVGSYDAMTKKGFEFTDVQKKIIEGEATQQEIAQQLGAEYLNMSSDMQAVAAINQVIDEGWANMYNTMSNTPQGKMQQLINQFNTLKTDIGQQLSPAIENFMSALSEAMPSISASMQSIVPILSTIINIAAIGVGGLASFGELLANIGQVITNNWGLIAPILIGVGTAIAIVTAAQALLAVFSGIAAAATVVQTIAQQGLNAALNACPIVWIITLIITLITLVYLALNAIAQATGVANSGLGIIGGALNVTKQLFINFFALIGNIFAGIGSAAAALGSNIMTAFHNAICSVQAWWYDLLSTVLNVISGVCEALNKIPFVSFDYSGLTSAAADYANKSAEAAANKNEYKDIGAAFSEGFSTFEYGDIGQAWDSGVAWGDGIADGMSNALSSFTSGFDTSSYLTDSSMGGFGSATDGIEQNTANTAGNTAKIADAVDVSNENLKYMKDLAEREAINRFTTADINVTMNNSNNITGSNDLDSIMDGFASRLTESLQVVRDGV